MNTVPDLQLEDVARLLEIEKLTQALARERKAILMKAVRTECKEPVLAPIEFTFGKNIITWNGGAVALAGVEYKIVKALYEAKNMRLKEETLGQRAWGKETTHEAFKERVRCVTEKLEKAKSPYRLFSVMSKEKTIPTGEKYRNGKQKFKHLRPVIIGVKLITTSSRANVAVDGYRLGRHDY